MRSQPNRTLPFFVLVFALTWGLQVPGLLARAGVLPGDPKLYLPFAGLGMLGPLAAALILTLREGGKPALGALFRPLLSWRVSPRWYVAALLPALLLTLLLVLLNLAGRPGPIAYVPTLGGLLFGILASISEEVAWRGYALPRLQKSWGSFAASGLLGVLWYLWHIPMFIGQGVPLNLFLVMLLYFVGASLFLTRIYNGTGGSLLLVSLGHLAAHLNNSHRALPAEVLPLVAHAIVYGAFGLLMLRQDLRITARTPCTPR
jgi:membrane protease YdiL (CAAX protease family)